MSDDAYRGTGRTTRQMQQAPIGAVYIWCNNLLDYPKRLADKLGRSDLKIVGTEWLENRRWRGVEISGLDIDHAARLTASQMAELDGALPYIRRSK